MVHEFLNDFFVRFNRRNAALRQKLQKRQNIMEIGLPCVCRIGFLICQVVAEHGIVVIHPRVPHFQYHDCAAQQRRRMRNACPQRILMKRTEKVYRREE